MKNEVLVRTVVMTMGVAVCAWNAALAAGWPGVGKYVATDASSFVNEDDPSTPFELGEGMLLYTGSSTLTDVMMTLNVAAGTGANAINVQNADTTLTLAGKINQTRGCFIKTGSGTLAFAYPGYQQLGPGPQDANKLTRDVKWDETTGACTNGGFADFTVDQGSLVLGAPGQTNEIKGMVFIGNRTQNKVRLAVTNGVLKQSGNWLCVARGTGQTTNDAEAEVYVGKDAALTASQLNLGYPNNMSQAYPRAKLTIDGGSVSVSSEIYALENCDGTAEIVITNGGSFASTQYNHIRGGWQTKNADTGKASVTVTAGSTARTYYLGMRTGSALLVNGGSKFLFDRMLPNNAALVSIGTATFDGATLGTERTGEALWFHGMNTGYFGRDNGFTVGANGLVIDVPENADAALYPTIKTASGATADNVTITKRGKGSAAIALPAKNRIVVEGGDLRLRNRLPNLADVASQKPTVAAGSKLIAAGEEAFANLTIPTGTPIVLRSQGVEMEKGGNWLCNSWATVRPDGVISLSDTRSSSVGSAFMRKTVDVSKSFRLTFDMTMSAPGSVWFRDGGMSVCFCANTPYVCGNGGNADIGYYNGAFTNAANKSVAFGMHGTDLMLSYGQDGKKSGDTVPLRMNATQLRNTLETPHRATVDYDAASGRLSLAFKFRCGISRTISRNVNLVSALGATSAYLGFTGSTSNGGPVDYLVSNVAFSDIDAPVAMRVGGNVTASAATPLSAEVVADEGDPALMMKSLSYSDGAVLDIGSSAVGGKGEIWAKPRLAQDAGWELLGGAHWLGSDSIGLSYTNYDAQGVLSRVSGAAYSPRPIRVDRDWTVDFDFSMGRKGGSVKADAFGFGLVSQVSDGNERPSTGFHVQVRYYYFIPEGSTVQGPWDATRLSFHKNGAEVYKADWVYDCAPVKLYSTEAAHVTFAYAKAAKTLTITLVDAKGTYRKTLQDFDMKEMLDGTDTAYLRLHGAVGGSWTENVISNLKFTASPDRAVPQSALGFDNWNGSGKVVKRGSGALAVVSNCAQNVSVKLEDGGLYLAKEAVNDYFDTGRGGWLRGDSLPGDARYGGVLVGAPSPTGEEHSRASNVHFTRRLPMGRNWTLSADLYALGFQDWGTGGAQNGPGEGLTIYAHNDSHGISYRGGSGVNGGFANNVKNGWALNFYTYTDAEKKFRYCWTTGGHQYLVEGKSASYSPVTLWNGSLTHFDVVHDAAAKTVKVTLSQEDKVSTTTFSSVDIKQCLGGDDMAWFGFGTGGGWAHGMFDWHNVRLTFPDSVDADADVNFLKDVEITAEQSAVFVDSRRANGVFRLAPTVSVAAGSAMVARSVGLPSTLTMGTLTLGEGATVGGDANTVVKPDALVTAGDLHVEGTTLALNSTDSVGDDADVYLTSGAKLRLDFNGTLFVRRVYVDGVRQPRGVFGPGTDWIDPASTGSLANGSGLMLLLR